MKKLCLRLPDHRTYNFWNSDFLIFLTSKTTFCENFMKSLPVLKIDFESTDKVYDLKFLDNETTSLSLKKICMEERFASSILSNKGNIKASILLILLKCIAVRYSNGNESFTGRLLSNYRPLNMLFHFFRYLIYCVFQKVYKETIPFQLNFQKSIWRCSILLKIRMSNFVILKWWSFEYKVKSWKICPFLWLFSQK